MKKPLQNLDHQSLDQQFTSQIPTLPTNTRPNTNSHNIRYSKAFLSLLQQDSTKIKKPLFDESDYKSFFSKTQTSGFNSQKTNIKNLTRTSFNQTKNSFHSNLFITTKQMLLSPKESICINNEKNQQTYDYNKPATSMVKHRYKKSNFLDDKVLTENFFLSFDSELKKNPMKNENNQRIIHSSSVTFLNKVSRISNLNIKPQIQKPTMRPEDFDDFKKKVILNGNEQINLMNKSLSKRLFKIKTMFPSTPNEELKLSIQRTIEKKLIQFSEEKIISSFNVKKTMLIIEDSLLDKCNHKASMKYFYLNLPSFQNQLFEKSKECFQIVLKAISNKLHLNARTIYLYLKNGAPIKDLFDIPENEITLIVSPSSSFRGFDNNNALLKFQLLKTLNIINQLETSLKMYNQLMGQEHKEKDKTYEAKIKEEHKELIKNTVKLIEGEHLDKFEEKKLRFRTKQEYFDEKNAQEPLFETRKFIHLDKIEKLYDTNLKQIKFEKMEVMDSSDEDVQQVRRRTSQATPLIAAENYQEYSLKIAEKLDVLMKKWTKKQSKKIKNKPKQNKKEEEKKEEEENDSEKGEEENEDIDENLLGDNENKIIDFVEVNKNKFKTKKRVIELMNKQNKELFLQNIPKLMKKTSFTRSEMHSTYILYKVLQEITSQQYSNYSIDEGMDYNSFRNGIPQIFHQAEEIAQKIFNTIDFNFSGFLNWEEFISLMEIIKAKTLKEKINLFIKIADDDGNGQLSKKEIFDLCRICLGKVIKTSEGDELFLEDISNYFTKLIFSAVEVDIDEEIPLTKIKETILSGNVESDLLCMFCGADI